MKAGDKSGLIPGIGPESKSEQGIPFGDISMTSLLNFEHALRGGVPLQDYTERFHKHRCSSSWPFLWDLVLEASLTFAA